MLGKDALISGNRAHREPVVAAVVVRVRAARTEVQAVGVVRVRRVLRGRPVEAARTGIVEAGVVAAARCWQEDAAAIRAGEQSPTNTILGCPCRSAIVKQLILLLFRRHHPRASPFHVGNVILSSGNVAAEVMTSIV